MIGAISVLDLADRILHLYEKLKAVNVETEYINRCIPLVSCRGWS